METLFTQKWLKNDLKKNHVMFTDTGLERKLESTFCLNAEFGKCLLVISWKKNKQKMELDLKVAEATREDWIWIFLE
jgi:hypothetical protein